MPVFSTLSRHLSNNYTQLQPWQWVELWKSSMVAIRAGEFPLVCYGLPSLLPSFHPALSSRKCKGADSVKSLYAVTHSGLCIRKHEPTLLSSDAQLTLPPTLTHKHTSDLSLPYLIVCVHSMRKGLSFAVSNQPGDSDIVKALLHIIFEKWIAAWHRSVLDFLPNSV